MRFLFKVPEGGTADVGIGVDTGGWISGTIQFESGSLPPPPPFSELAGKSLPFVISFEAATVTRSIESGKKRVTIQTSPVTLQFGGATGAAFQKEVVAALQGRTTSFFLEPPTSYSATRRISPWRIWSRASSSSSAFRSSPEAWTWRAIRSWIPWTMEWGSRTSTPDRV